MWDEYGEDELGFTCRGYPVFAMLLMRAGAAMPPGLRDAFLGVYDGWLEDVSNSTAERAGKRFVTQQVRAEIRRYDIRGGRTFRLPLELPSDIVAGHGPRFRFLSDNHESLPRDLQTMSFRTEYGRGATMMSINKHPEHTLPGFVSDGVLCRFAVLTMPTIARA